MMDVIAKLSTLGFYGLCLLLHLFEVVLPLNFCLQVKQCSIDRETEIGI